MGRSERSRSRSPEPRRDRSRSRERRRDRSGRSPVRRRDDRRRSPDRQPRDRSPRREERPRQRSPRREERPQRERSLHREEQPRDGGDRQRSRERDQRPMPAPERRGPGPCFKCGEEGHLARDCPTAPPSGPGGGGRGACFKCGEEGHIARDCPNPEVAGAGPGRRRRGGGGGGDEADMAWGKPGEQDEEEVPDKEVEPEFGLSGALAAETNKVNGVVLLHQEPPEARKPTARWRLYVFKDGKPFGDHLHIHRMSSYLFGRERRVADIPTDHPSCSKQHAVLQFRLTEKEGADGMMKGAVRPYLMDLGSTNGSFLNGERLEPERYYELLEQDMIKFGNSTREYVLIKEK